MERVARLVLAILFAVGVATSQVASSNLQFTGFDDLVEAKGRFAQNTVRPGADLSNYAAIRVLPVVINFAVHRSDVLSADVEQLAGVFPDSWYRRELENVMGRALIAELERKGYQVVPESKPNTLILQAVIVNFDTRPLASSSAKHGSTYDPSQVEWEYEDPRTARVGEGTLVLDLVDGETGVVQARFGGREHISAMWGWPEPATDSEVVDRWSRGVARELWKTLKEFGYEK
ncbi:MAG: DUF3313 family protein [bacterium]|nr:DUF3313 family protein [bacterium]